MEPLNSKVNPSGLSTNASIGLDSFFHFKSKSRASSDDTVMFLHAARAFGLDAARALAELMGWKVDYIPEVK